MSPRPPAWPGSQRRPDQAHLRGIAAALRAAYRDRLGDPLPKDIEKLLQDLEGVN